MLTEFVIWMRRTRCLVLYALCSSGATYELTRTSVQQHTPSISVNHIAASWLPIAQCRHLVNYTKSRFVTLGFSQGSSSGTVCLWTVVQTSSLQCTMALGRLKSDSQLHRCVYNACVHSAVLVHTISCFRCLKQLLYRPTDPVPHACTTCHMWVMHAVVFKVLMLVIC